MANGKFVADANTKIKITPEYDKKAGSKIAGKIEADAKQWSDKAILKATIDDDGVVSGLEKFTDPSKLKHIPIVFDISAKWRDKQIQAKGLKGKSEKEIMMSLLGGLGGGVGEVITSGHNRIEIDDEIVKGFNDDINSITSELKNRISELDELKKKKAEYEKKVEELSSSKKTSKGSVDFDKIARDFDKLKEETLSMSQDDKKYDKNKKKLEEMASVLLFGFKSEDLRKNISKEYEEGLKLKEEISSLKKDIEVQRKLLQDSQKELDRLSDSGEMDIIYPEEYNNNTEEIKKLTSKKDAYKALSSDEKGKKDQKILSYEAKIDKLEQRNKEIHDSLVSNSSYDQSKKILSKTISDAESLISRLNESISEKERYLANKGSEYEVPRSVFDGISELVYNEVLDYGEEVNSYINEYLDNGGGGAVEIKKIKELSPSEIKKQIKKNKEDIVEGGKTYNKLTKSKLSKEDLELNNKLDSEIEENTIEINSLKQRQSELELEIQDQRNVLNSIKKNRDDYINDNTSRNSDFGNEEIEIQSKKSNGKKSNAKAYIKPTDFEDAFVEVDVKISEETLNAAVDEINKKAGIIDLQYGNIDDFISELKGAVLALNKNKSLEVKVTPKIDPTFKLRIPTAVVEQLELSKSAMVINSRESNDNNSLLNTYNIFKETQLQMAKIISEQVKANPNLADDYGNLNVEGIGGVRELLQDQIRALIANSIDGAINPDDLIRVHAIREYSQMALRKPDENGVLPDKAQKLNLSNNLLGYGGFIDPKFFAEIKRAGNSILSVVNKIDKERHAFGMSDKWDAQLAKLIQQKDEDLNAKRLYTILADLNNVLSEYKELNVKGHYEYRDDRFVDDSDRDKRTGKIKKTAIRDAYSAYASDKSENNLNKLVNLLYRYSENGNVDASIREVLEGWKNIKDDDKLNSIREDVNSRINEYQAENIAINKYQGQLIDIFNRFMDGRYVKDEQGARNSFEKVINSDQKSVFNFFRGLIGRSVDLIGGNSLTGVESNVVQKIAENVKEVADTAKSEKEKSDVKENIQKIEGSSSDIDSKRENEENPDIQEFELLAKFGFDKDNIGKLKTSIEEAINPVELVFAPAEGSIDNFVGLLGKSLKGYNIPIQNLGSKTPRRSGSVNPENTSTTTKKEVKRPKSINVIDELQNVAEDVAGAVNKVSSIDFSVLQEGKNNPHLQQKGDLSKNGSSTIYKSFKDAAEKYFKNPNEAMFNRLVAFKYNYNPKNSDGTDNVKGKEANLNAIFSGHLDVLAAIDNRIVELQNAMSSLVQPVKELTQTVSNDVAAKNEYSQKENEIVISNAEFTSKLESLLNRKVAENEFGVLRKTTSLNDRVSESDLVLGTNNINIGSISSAVNQLQNNPTLETLNKLTALVNIYTEQNKDNNNALNDMYNVFDNANQGLLLVVHKNLTNIQNALDSFDENINENQIQEQIENKANGIGRKILSAAHSVVTKIVGSDTKLNRTFNKKDLNPDTGISASAIRRDKSSINRANWNKTEDAKAVEEMAKKRIAVYTGDVEKILDKIFVSQKELEIQIQKGEQNYVRAAKLKKFDDIQRKYADDPDVLEAKEYINSLKSVSNKSSNKEESSVKVIAKAIDNGVKNSVRAENIGNTPKYFNDNGRNKPSVSLESAADHIDNAASKLDSVTSNKFDERIFRTGDNNPFIKKSDLKKDGSSSLNSVKIAAKEYAEVGSIASMNRLASLVNILDKKTVNKLRTDDGDLLIKLINRAIEKDTDLNISEFNNVVSNLSKKTKDHLNEYEYDDQLNEIINAVNNRDKDTVNNLLPGLEKTFEIFTSSGLVDVFKSSAESIKNAQQYIFNSKELFEKEKSQSPISDSASIKLQQSSKLLEEVAKENLDNSNALEQIIDGAQSELNKPKNDIAPIEASAENIEGNIGQIANGINNLINEENQVASGHKIVENIQDESLPKFESDVHVNVIVDNADTWSNELNTDISVKANISNKKEITDYLGRKRQLKVEVAISNSNNLFEGKKEVHFKGILDNKETIMNGFKNTIHVNIVVDNNRTVFDGIKKEIYVIAKTDNKDNVFEDVDKNVKIHALVDNEQTVFDVLSSQIVPINVKVANLKSLFNDLGDVPINISIKNKDELFKYFEFTNDNSIKKVAENNINNIDVDELFNKGLDSYEKKPLTEREYFSDRYELNQEQFKDILVRYSGAELGLFRSDSDDRRVDYIKRKAMVDDEYGISLMHINDNLSRIIENSTGKVIDDYSHGIGEIKDFNHTIKEIYEKYKDIILDLRKDSDLINDMSYAKKNIGDNNHIAINEEFGSADAYRSKILRVLETEERNSKEIHNAEKYIEESGKTFKQTVSDEEKNDILNFLKNTNGSNLIKKHKHGAIDLMDMLTSIGINPLDLAYHSGQYSFGEPSHKFSSYLSDIANNGRPNYGAAGSGTYITHDGSNYSEVGYNTSSKINVFDTSKFNMFKTKTTEMERRLYEFLLYVQKMSFVATDYTGFDEELENIDVKKLFDDYQDVCDAIGLDFRTLRNFISEMQDYVSKGYGKHEISSFGKGIFKYKTDDSLRYSGNISSILMERLGFEGVDNRYTDFDEFHHGSVIYTTPGTKDKRSEPIIVQEGDNESNQKFADDLNDIILNYFGLKRIPISDKYTWNLLDEENKDTHRYLNYIKDNDAHENGIEKFIDHYVNFENFIGRHPFTRQFEKDGNLFFQTADGYINKFAEIAAAYNELGNIDIYDLSTGRKLFEESFMNEKELLDYLDNFNKKDLVDKKIEEIYSNPHSQKRLNEIRSRGRFEINSIRNNGDMEDSIVDKKISDSIKSKLVEAISKEKQAYDGTYNKWNEGIINKLRESVKNNSPEESQDDSIVQSNHKEIHITPIIDNLETLFDGIDRNIHVNLVVDNYDEIIAGASKNIYVGKDSSTFKDISEKLHSFGLENQELHVNIVIDNSETVFDNIEKNINAHIVIDNESNLFENVNKELVVTAKIDDDRILSLDSIKEIKLVGTIGNIDSLFEGLSKDVYFTAHIDNPNTALDEINKTVELTAVIANKDNLLADIGNDVSVNIIASSEDETIKSLLDGTTKSISISIDSANKEDIFNEIGNIPVNLDVQNFAEIRDSLKEIKTKLVITNQEEVKKVASDAAKKALKSSPKKKENNNTSTTVNTNIPLEQRREDLKKLAMGSAAEYSALLNRKLLINNEINDGSGGKLNLENVLNDLSGKIGEIDYAEDKESIEKLEEAIFELTGQLKLFSTKDNLVQNGNKTFLGRMNSGSAENFEDIVKKYLEEKFGISKINIYTKNGRTRWSGIREGDDGRRVAVSGVASARSDENNPLENIISTTMTDSQYKGWGEKWVEGWKRRMVTLSQYFSGIKTYQLIFNELRKSFQSIVELDARLTTINQTMKVTTSEMRQIGSSSIAMAKNLGTTAENVLNAVAIYANANETAQSILSKSQPTVMLANAGGFDTSTASNYVQSVTQQFEELEGQERRVVNSFEKISAGVAIDFAKGLGIIAEATQNAGSIASESGMSFEQFAASAAKISEKTRLEGSVIGNA